MNTLRHIAPFRFALLFLVLSALVSLAQAPLDDDMSRRSPEAEPEGYPTGQVLSDGEFLPEGIEATGDTMEVKALRRWAVEHQNSLPEQAGQAARRALTLARRLNDQRGIAGSLVTLGNVAYLTSRFDQAESFYMAAQEAHERAGNERGMIANYINLGNVYAYRGNVERALAAYFDALNGLKRFGDVENQARVLSSIGAVHKKQGDFEEALSYYLQAVELAESLDDAVLLASTLNNVAVLRMEMGLFEAAESDFRRALALYEQENVRLYIATVTSNLGDLFNKQQRYEQAVAYLKTAERMGRELEAPELLIDVTLQLGKASLGMGENDRALRYANESLVLAREEELVSREMDAHETLSQIYKEAGNHEQALTHHEAFVVARDSVFSVERAEVVAEMQTRYETEEKQRAIERLEYENQIRLILLLTGVGGLLLLLVVLFYRYRLKQKANRLLEELDAAKSRFFANISHEFRTPLTVILGGMQDMIDGQFDGNKEKLSEQQHAVLRNAHQLRQLVGEVLDLNRLETGKLELQSTPGDLVRSLQRIVEADAPLAERNGIELTFDHDVEHCPRHSDEEKLEKIVGNLLSNALKFTPKGGSVRMSLNCGKQVEISVADDGPGIPAESQEKVFERFAQAEDSSLHGGTGIGLALAKELAELHGGTITLESESGEGSTFTVRLPLEVAALSEIAEKELNVGANGHEGPSRSDRRGEYDVGVPLVVAQQTEETDDNPDVSRRPAAAKPSEAGSEAEPDRTTILIIEDNADVRVYVRRSLEETYRVLEAADGEVGLQQARAELPDLIVSDVMLPGIDGYEVARRLKAEPSTECIPIVMLTARAAEEDQTEGYGSGAEVYITKPFSSETLQAAVARLLEERRRLRKRLQENAKQQGGEPPRNDQPTLADRARAIILENLHDERFGVEELASSLNMARRTLYHRFKSEVDLSPGDFVRTVRLERARKLLSNGAGSVSEVAYAVGFNSLVAFSRAYSAHYGTPPSSDLSRENTK